MQFLVIDDDPDYRRLIVQHLSVRWPDARIKEYDPLRSGPLPEEFIAAGTDLVLLGHPCGGEDAVECLRRFRRQPAFPPVVLIGDGDERQVVRAVREGAVDYVGKPSLRHGRLVEAAEGALSAAASRPPGSRFPAPGDSTTGTVASLRNYRMLRPLADGEIAAVYLAEDRKTGRQVALKIVRQLPDTADATLLDRFLREFELVAGIDHPNVVRIHDFGVADDHAYIAMEYCGGGSLKRRIRAGLSPEESVRILRDIAGALGALHGAGILHRDLKPTNVLFRTDGSLVLIDFGLARQVMLRAELTGAGQIFGTPYYMSPEQGHAEPVDHRGDLYSLGVIFYEMLTGSKPFDGETAMGVIVKHRQAPVPELPEALARYQPIVNGLLAKRPADRFASAGEVLEHTAG